MTLADYILQKNQVILSQTETSKGGDVFVLQNTNLLYGVTEAVNSISTLFVVGQRVMFNPNDASQFLLNDVLYYLMDEDKIILIEA